MNVKLTYYFVVTVPFPVRYGRTQSNVMPAEYVPSDWRTKLDEPSLSFSPPVEPSFPYDEDANAPEGLVDAGHPEDTGKLEKRHFWPKAGNTTVIAYHIEGFSRNQEQTIVVALEKIEQQTGTCITFTRINATSARRRPEQNYINFTYNQEGDLCYTNIGRRRRNPIILADACLNHPDVRLRVGTVVHEVLHKLGFFHEHSRPDRGDFVNVHLENIRPIASDQFKTLPGMDTYGFGYDFESIMHYGPLSGVTDENEPSMTPRTRNEKVRMGQRIQLSDTDVKKILLAYECSTRENLSAALDAIKQAYPSGVLEPPKFTIGKNFSLDRMTQEEWSRQEIGQICQFPISQKTAKLISQVKAVSISCNNKVTRAALKNMSIAISKGPARPVGIFLHDSLRNIERDVFHPIADNVVILLLRYCVKERTTDNLRLLKFFNLVRFHLSNCVDLDIRKKDFDGLQYLRMLTFSNTTIKNLQEDAFQNMPQLVTLSLEHAAYSMSKSLEYMVYLDRLHCGCEFSWFRRFLHSNMDKVYSKTLGEIYNLPQSWVNLPVSSRTLHVPYDCQNKSVVPAGINENLPRFFFNNGMCKPEMQS